VTDVNSDTAIASVASYLERDRLVVERDGDTLHVSSPDGAFVFAPVVRLPADLLSSYLDQADAPPWGGDPRVEALSLLKINILEELATDHGEGRNYTQAVGLRRGRGGLVELFVDQARPERPDLAPDPDLRWEARRPSEW
jgi:hypothetical protein